MITIRRWRNTGGITRPDSLLAGIAYQETFHQEVSGGEALSRLPGSGGGAGGIDCVTADLVTTHSETADLAVADLAAIWQRMCDERLVDVFFYEGTVQDLAGFLRYATDRNTWFHLAELDGVPLGFGVVNGFSSSGRSGFGHFCCFAAGRGGCDGGLFTVAALRWLAMLERAGLRSLVAVTPAVYRSALHWIWGLGFAERCRLPEALRVVRKGRDGRENREHITDAVISVLYLEACDGRQQQESVRGGGESGGSARGVHAGA